MYVSFAPLVGVSRLQLQLPVGAKNTVWERDNSDEVWGRDQRYIGHVIGAHVSLRFELLGAVRSLNWPRSPSLSIYPPAHFTTGHTLSYYMAMLRRTNQVYYNNLKRNNFTILGLQGGHLVQPLGEWTTKLKVDRSSSLLAATDLKEGIHLEFKQLDEALMAKFHKDLGDPIFKTPSVGGGRTRSIQKESLQVMLDILRSTELLTAVQHSELNSVIMQIVSLSHLKAR